MYSLVVPIGHFSTVLITDKKRTKPMTLKRVGN